MPRRTGVGAARFAAAVVLPLSLGLAACGPGGEPLGLSEGSAIQPATQAAQFAAASQPEGGVYKVTSGDILEVNVYQVQELSRVVEVDGAGNINLPLIGATPAAGRSVRELELDIARRLDARYLRSPQVSVFVKESAGLRVTVEGAVKKPGVIATRGQMTLLQVIAQAQGFTDTADVSNVLVFRNTPSGRVVARFNANEIRRGSSPDPVIQGRDTVVVDDSTAKTAWKYLREAVPAAGLMRVF